VAQAVRTLEWATELSPTQAALLCFSATTAITGTLLQFEGQRTVPAAAAQPIYAAAPLLTAMWSLVVLKEPITQFEALGGLGVFFAATLASSGGGDAATVEEAAPLRPLSTEATTTDEKNGA
jgi:drug/metabolite transporter (DMT)-like permease